MVRLALAEFCEVREAVDGGDGLAQLKFSPAAVILDLAMPGLGGMAVLRALRAARPELPVLVLTGEHDTTAAKEALDSGADAYLTKPFEVHVLREEVRRLLALPHGAGEARPWRMGA